MLHLGCFVIAAVIVPPVHDLATASLQFRAFSVLPKSFIMKEVNVASICFYM